MYDDNIEMKKLSTTYTTGLCVLYGARIVCIAEYYTHLLVKTFFVLFMFHFLESVFPEFKCALI